MIIPATVILLGAGVTALADGGWSVATAEQLQKAEQAGEDVLDQTSQGLIDNFISEPKSSQPTSKVH